MSHQDDRIRVFVYHEDQHSADEIAMLLWQAEFECWPFTNVHSLASAFAKYPPRLAILQFTSLQEVEQTTVLLAAMCPDCRFFVFARTAKELHQRPDYRKENNYEIFVLHPTPQDIVRLAHNARNKMSYPGAELG